jgi:hypothetical protein
MNAQYLALTIFADAANTIVDRVVHLEGEGASFWLTKANELTGHVVKEGEIVLGVRIDRIDSEDAADAYDYLEDFNNIGSRHHY